MRVIEGVYRPELNLSIEPKKLVSDFDFLDIYNHFFYNDDPIQSYYTDSLDFNSKTQIPGSREIFQLSSALVESSNDLQIKEDLVHLIRQIMGYSARWRQTVNYHFEIFRPIRRELMVFFDQILEILALYPKYHAIQIAIIMTLKNELRILNSDFRAGNLCGNPVIRLDRNDLGLCERAEKLLANNHKKGETLVADNHLLLKSASERGKAEHGYLEGLCLRSTMYPNGAYFQAGVWYCPTDRKAVRTHFDRTGHVDLSVSGWVPIRAFNSKNIPVNDFEAFKSQLSSLNLSKWKVLENSNIE